MRQGASPSLMKVPVTEQPMIPDHIVALALVIVIGWMLYRWGALIFMGYALYHFWVGEYFFAVFAFAVAWFIEAVKAPTMFMARLEGIWQKSRGHATRI
jgi:hypothetical protein